MALDELEIAIQKRLSKRFGLYATDFAYENRDFKTYLALLFRDDPQSMPSRRSNIPIYDFPFYTYKFGKRGSSERVEVEDQVFFGGISEFFRSGSRILDVGSGGGTATRQMNEQYHEQGVKVFGLDFRYALKFRRPETKTYVGGNWMELPFATDSFKRLLGYESFPAHAQSGVDPAMVHNLINGYKIERYLQTFREITRVATEGSIWRGTFHDNLEYWKRRKIHSSAEALCKIMTDLGWEIYYSPQFARVDVGTFVAKLVKKGKKQKLP